MMIFRTSRLVGYVNSLEGIWVGKLHIGGAGSVSQPNNSEGGVKLHGTENSSCSQISLWYSYLIVTHLRAVSMETSWNERWDHSIPIIRKQFRFFSSCVFFFRVVGFGEKNDFLNLRTPRSNLWRQRWSVKNRRLGVGDGFGTPLEDHPS